MKARRNLNYLVMKINSIKIKGCNVFENYVRAAVNFFKSKTKKEF